MSEEYKHTDVTNQIIKAAYKVYKTLGYGFLEKVYENAMRVDLKKWGLDVQQQAPAKVSYEGEIVGDFYTDLIVAGKVILELKAVGRLESVHEVQLVNYLKASDIEVGLLINFGPKLEIKRRVFSKKHGVSAVEDEEF